MDINWRESTTITKGRKYGCEPNILLCAKANKKLLEIENVISCSLKLRSISKLSHIGYILIAQVINSNIYTLPSYIDASWVFILQFYLIQQLPATYVDRILTYIQRKFHLSFKYKLLSLSISKNNLPLTTHLIACSSRTGFSLRNASFWHRV